MEAAAVKAAAGRAVTFLVADWAAVTVEAMAATTAAELVVATEAMEATVVTWGRRMVATASATVAAAVEAEAASSVMEAT